MKSLTEKEKTYYLETWPKNRNSKWWYIFKMGVLYWGLPVFAILTIYQAYKHHDYRLDILDLAVGFSVWCAAGTLYGLWFYKVNEKKYKQALLSQ